MKSEVLLNLIQEQKFIYIQSPMVRYSKLPFRMLCRRWGCDVVYTPMIVSKEFVASKHARMVEFSTNQYDRPLITQFAANDGVTLGMAGEIVSNYCDGIDINCGCPQRWAIDEGYGCGLLNRPELIQDMIRIGKEMSGLPVSIKIRVESDIATTIELARRAQSMGANWITVHGRTVKQKSSALIDYEAIKIVKESLSIPVIGNGHCFNLEDVLKMKEKTGVDGIMSARGILENPALYLGYPSTPMKVITEFIDIALNTSLSSHLLHQHLVYMLYRHHKRIDKAQFNNIKSIPGILNFLEERGINIEKTDLNTPVIERGPLYHLNEKIKK
jgi:tRNA-dihydrouridine synthase 4